MTFHLVPRTCGPADVGGEGNQQAEGRSGGSAGGGAAGAVYYFADYGGQGVDVVLGGGVAQGETQGTAGAGVVGAEGQQHVAGLGHARGAGGAGGAGDSVRVEQHEQGVALATREGEVRVAGEPGRAGRGAVEHGVGNDGEDPSHKGAAESALAIPVLSRQLPRTGRGSVRGTRRAGPRRPVWSCP